MMNRAQVVATKLAFLALFTTGVALGQETHTPTQTTYPAQTNESGAPMTKGELKAQRAQQKKEEKASNSSAKSAKSDAKAEKAHNKVVQDQEKAGERTTNPPANPPQI